MTTTCSSETLKGLRSTEGSLPYVALDHVEKTQIQRHKSDNRAYGNYDMTQDLQTLQILKSLKSRGQLCLEVIGGIPLGRGVLGGRSYGRTQAVRVPCQVIELPVGMDGRESLELGGGRLDEGASGEEEDPGFF